MACFKPGIGGGVVITAGPVEGFGNAAVEGGSLGVLVNRRQRFPLILGAEMAVAVSC